MRYGLSCQLRIEFHPLLQKNVLRHRSSFGHVKKKVIRAIIDLYDEGYRHFVINIIQPTDLWVAEIIYFMTLSHRGSGICYSLGLWLDDEDAYVWLDKTSMFCDEVFRNAKRVFWRSQKWYDNYYEMKWIYIGLK